MAWITAADKEDQYGRMARMLSCALGGPVQTVVQFDDQGQLLSFSLFPNLPTAQSYHKDQLGNRRTAFDSLDYR